MKMIASNIEMDDHDYLTKTNDEAELIALNLLLQKIDEKCISESIMVVCFNNLKTKYNSSSMWVEYSMLKTMIARNHNINKKYDNLTAFLKKNSVEFLPKKSNIFQPEYIRIFLSAAADTNFLTVKVKMIFGVNGATGVDKLTKAEVNEVCEKEEDFRNERTSINLKVQQTSSISCWS